MHAPLASISVVALLTLHIPASWADLTANLLTPPYAAQRPAECVDFQVGSRIAERDLPTRLRARDPRSTGPWAAAARPEPNVIEGGASVRYMEYGEDISGDGPPDCKLLLVPSNGSVTVLMRRPQNRTGRGSNFALVQQTNGRVLVEVDEIVRLGTRDVASVKLLKWGGRGLVPLPLTADAYRAFFRSIYGEGVGLAISASDAALLREKTLPAISHMGLNAFPVVFSGRSTRGQRVRLTSGREEAWLIPGFLNCTEASFAASAILDHLRSIAGVPRDNNIVCVEAER